MTRDTIQIRGAREHNLKNISLDLPKHHITAVTGVSGSGKSSLVFGTIAAESQRLLNETFSAFVQGFLPRIGQPDVDSLANLSATIIVDQKRIGGNSRSTVSTITDVAPLLRLLFSRAGDPRLATASMFSFNDPRGMCMACEGLGRIASIDEGAIVDRAKSLNEGALLPREYAVGGWFWNIYAQSGLFDLDKRISDYSAEELDALLHRAETKIKVGKHNIKYEGVIPKVRRLLGGKDPDQLQPHVRAEYDRIFTLATCPTCGGARLNAQALAVRVASRSIAELAAMQVSDLVAFVKGLEAPGAAPVIAALTARLEALVEIGLGYLSLDRETSTLSGGESQRVKMVRHLGSALTDLIYVLDEPSIGLHPHDLGQLGRLVRGLRDKGNTVLLVEHEPDMIAIADHVVDLGPGAGSAGGEILYQGDLRGLLASGTATGRHMKRRQQLKTSPREPTGQLRIRGARMHNLRGLDVDIPRGVLTAVTGVAGSGKSTLILGCLPKACPDAIVIDQSLTRGSRRSNTATYTGILDPIRKAFARANKVDVSLFSANSKGACPDCDGLGIVYTDFAHLDPVITTCETCEGKRFTDEVLRHELRGRTIADVYDFSVAEAAAFFTEPAIQRPLAALVDVGLGYLGLGRAVSSLSGGERQRLKLAGELHRSGQTYILDEPTTGLHMADVATLIGLLDRLVDAGSTVIVIEHDLDVVARADWVVDLGPGAGKAGGTLVFAGPPAALAAHEASLTGRYLARHVAQR
jgi:excinuclease UvrABC ATPase subunit